MSVHRKRMRRMECVGHVRYLTFSCYQRLPLFQNNKIKDRFCEHLAHARAVGMFKLYGWVVIPTHVHLLLEPRLPDWTVANIMHTLKRPFAQEIIGRWRALNARILLRMMDRGERIHFWQAGGGYDRNIISSEEYVEKLRYIHDNPRRAELVDRATDWPWSSAGWYGGERMVPIPIDTFGRE